MDILIKKIKALKQNPALRGEVNAKIKEFEKNRDWHSELCYCIMTANAKAIPAIEMQKNTDFLKLSKNQLAKRFRGKIRFHNNKAKYICESKKFANIKQILKDKNDFEAREWLVKNIKGIGMKEASHFLRNVGYKNAAILDRHILNVLKHYGIIKKIPKLTKKNYLEIEKKMHKLAEASRLSQSELDLYLWWTQTGKVLK
jgi:N-glycosylase/DNA lyase